MPEAFAVPLPAQYVDTMRIFRWLAFDWLTVLAPSECYGGFALRLAGAAIVPLVGLLALGAAITLASVAASKLDAEAAPLLGARVRLGALRALPLVLMGLYALVLPVSSRIFSTWNCQPFGDAEGTMREFLDADLSVECAGDAYARLRAFAGVLIVLWPLGAPTLFVALLQASRRGAPWAVPLSRAIGFLHAEYTERCFYWSLVELGRTLFMCGFVFLIPFRWSILRHVLALLVGIAHLVLLQAGQPFRQRSTALVAIATSLGLVCTLLAALLVRFFNEIEQRTGLAEQPTDDGLFDADSAFVLTVLILAFNFSVLVLAAALILLEARHVAILRVLDTGHAPALSLGGAKRWHLFLSNNWVKQVRILA